MYVTVEQETPPPHSMTIRHQYMGFPIIFHGCYRVYDQYNNPGIADQYLRFRYFNHAKRYVDALVELLICPPGEPEQTHRLAGFYCNNRDDGPLPTVLIPNIHLGPEPTTCRHVSYNFNRGGWHYCQREVRRGSTRCYYHEMLPDVVLSPNEFRPRSLVKM